MDIASTLYPLLLTGAGLAARGVLGEVGKGAGKEAFEALKARLRGAFGAKSVDLIDDVDTNPAYEGTIRADLSKPEIAADAEVRALARTLEAAIAALPADVTAPYAVSIREIRAGRDLLFENVAGVEADIATTGGDMTFRGVAAPGKP